MTAPAPQSVRERVSPEEWQARVDLAAMYRLTALFGWDDLVFTHISMRVPGEDHHFLINPYGLLFEEVTASNLVKIDLDGRIVMETPYRINPSVLQFTAPFTRRVKTPSAFFTPIRRTGSPSLLKPTACCLFPSSRCSPLPRLGITTTRAWRSTKTKSRVSSPTWVTSKFSSCAITVC